MGEPGSEMCAACSKPGAFSTCCFLSVGILGNMDRFYLQRTLVSPSFFPHNLFFAHVDASSLMFLIDIVKQQLTYDIGWETRLREVSRGSLLSSVSNSDLLVASPSSKLPTNLGPSFLSSVALALGALTIWHAVLISRGETSIERHINKKERRRLQAKGRVSRAEGLGWRVTEPAVLETEAMAKANKGRPHRRSELA